jgi:hypothetical protein
MYFVVSRCGRRYDWSNVIKALQLIFIPTAGWERIVLDQRKLASILVWYLIPMLLLPAAAEGLGMVYWGKAQSATTVVRKPLAQSLGLVYWGRAEGQHSRLKKFPVSQTLSYEALQFVASLGLVFLAAGLFKSLGDTFHGRHTFQQTFTVAAYGLGPLFLLRLLDAHPIMPLWLTWTVGIFLSLGAIYTGLPIVMRPDPAHAFGLYLISALLLFLISGLMRFVTAWYLNGRLASVDALIPSF